MEQYELIDTYAHEGHVTLYRSGILHGLLTELEDAFYRCCIYANTLSAEYFDLEDYIAEGKSNEEAIELAIRRRMLNSLIPNEYGTNTAFYDSAPPPNCMKKFIEKGTIKVKYVADGGIKNVLATTFPHEDRENIDDKYRIYEEELKTVIDRLFDGDVLEYQLACDRNAPKFKDAPRYKIDIDWEVSRYNAMFGWIVFEVHAVVCGNDCIMFVYGNSD